MGEAEATRASSRRAVIASSRQRRQRMLASLLHGVVATDPVLFLLAATVAVCAGFSASLIPAWRAARTNPIEVLCQD